MNGKARSVKGVLFYSENGMAYLGLKLRTFWGFIY